MNKRIAIFALCALLLAACGCGGGAPAPENRDVAPAATPAVYTIGSAEGGAISLPVPTAPATSVPVGRVEYMPDDGAHYDILSDNTVSVTGGHVEILIDGMAFSNTVETHDGGSVRLTLTNGASLSGRLNGESMLDISVALDETCAWSLPADTRVDALVNGDETFSNVAGNGFTLSYNCENAENAYLGRAALPLSGSGQLSPVI